MLDLITNIGFIESNRYHCRPIYGTDDEPRVIRALAPLFFIYMLKSIFQYKFIDLICICLA